MIPDDLSYAPVNAIPAALSYIILEPFSLTPVDSGDWCRLSTDCFNPLNPTFLPNTPASKLFLFTHHIPSPWGQPGRCDVVESRAEKHKEVSPSSVGSRQGDAWQCLGRFWSLLQFLPDQSETPGCPEKRVLPGARGRSKWEVKMVWIGRENWDCNKILSWDVVLRASQQSR